MTLVLAMLPLLCRYAAQVIVESRSGKHEHKLIGLLPMLFKLRRDNVKPACKGILARGPRRRN